MNHGFDTGFLVAAELLEHPNHLAARGKIAALVDAGDSFAMAPHVLAEFIHVVTDLKRFAAPLSMDVARDVAEKWWTAKEVRQVNSDAAAVAQFLVWHRVYSYAPYRENS